MKPMLRSPRVAFWALAGVTLLLSHDAVWLFQLGPGRDVAAVLRDSQHGYWAAASVAILVAAAAAAVITGTRGVGLLRRARLLDVSVTGVRGRRVLTRWARAWMGLFAVVGIGFGIQENVEHFLRHAHVLGLGAITGPEYPLAIPVLAAVTAVAALLCALVGVVGEELAAGIAAAVRRLRLRAPRHSRRPPVLVPLRRPAMAGRDAGRAPPVLLVVT